MLLPKFLKEPVSFKTAMKGVCLMVAVLSALLVALSFGAWMVRIHPAVSAFCVALIVLALVVVIPTLAGFIKSEFIASLALRDRDEDEAPRRPQETGHWLVVVISITLWLLLSIGAVVMSLSVATHHAHSWKFVVGLFVGLAIVLGSLAFGLRTILLDGSEPDYDELDWSDVRRLSTDASDTAYFALVQTDEGKLLVRLISLLKPTKLGGGLEISYARGVGLLAFENNVRIESCVLNPHISGVSHCLTCFYTKNADRRFIIVSSIEHLLPFYLAWKKCGWVSRASQLHANARSPEQKEQTVQLS